MVAPFSYSEPPNALDYFATLVAEDESLPLLEAAASIAWEDAADLDLRAVLHQVDGLAQGLQQRLPADAVPLQRLRALNRYFYQECGFGGNLNHFYDPANSHIHHVLNTRRGIPITLAILYMEIAQHVGLRARGVAFPGHFLLKLRLPVAGQGRVGDIILDPMTGHSLSREELEELLEPYKRSQGLHGEHDVPLGMFLQGASSRDVLGRLLRNLKAIYQQVGDWPRALGTCNRLQLLYPERPQEWRDRAAVHEELGDDEAALRDLSLYLQAVPDAADRPELEARMARWRCASRPDAP